MDTTTVRERAPEISTSETRPHACLEGVVYVGYLVEDPNTGEEVVTFEVVPCRRCAGL